MMHSMATSNQAARYKSLAKIRASRDSSSTRGKTNRYTQTRTHIPYRLDASFYSSRPLFKASLARSRV